MGQRLRAARLVMARASLARAFFLPDFAEMSPAP
jgi:hypothetical protein